MVRIGIKPIDIPNPKLRNGESNSESSIYHFYAGYSLSFAGKLLARLGLTDDATVIDPWNGSGTTTLAAAKMGLPAKGFDLNPVMGIVARARLCARPSSLEQLLRYDWDAKIMLQRASAFAKSDPLRLWFSRSTSDRIRSLATAVQAFSVRPNAHGHPSIDAAEEETVRAVGLVALFRTVRTFLSNYETSNPTWIRHRLLDEEKRYVPGKKLAQGFLREIRKTIRALSDADVATWNARRIDIVNASSTSLPCTSESVDCVLTSPPYCTRIDYVVATFPELAVIGVSVENLRALRKQMMGSVLSGSESRRPLAEWGKECLAVLELVRTHGSKASATYYYRNLINYFRDLNTSITEISRVLKVSATCVMVVQDSFYKEIRIDLAKIVRQMSCHHGLHYMLSRDFESHSLSEIHPHSKKYRDGFRAKETVIVLQKKPSGALPDGRRQSRISCSPQTRGRSARRRKA